MVLGGRGSVLPKTIDFQAETEMMTSLVSDSNGGLPMYAGHHELQIPEC
jgi:hypothetical protein